jgi:hypothetical protein
MRDQTILNYQRIKLDEKIFEKKSLKTTATTTTTTTTTNTKKTNMGGRTTGI